jgi:glycosyltransferase involved in cell wall biosynthesis
MKLLLYSHSFAPNVGGVETIVMSLARGLADTRTMNNQPQFDITVVTETPAGDFDDRSLPFPVVRRPGTLALWRLIGEANVIHLAGPALLPLFLAWLARKPVALEHHGYQAVCPNGLLLHQPDGSICPGHFQARRYRECMRCQGSEMPWRESLRNLLLMFPRNHFAKSAACNIAVSRHVSERIELPRSLVVYHGVENMPSLNSRIAENAIAPATMRFAYVGRLVAEKGLPILVEAAGILKSEKREFALLFIGDGAQRSELEALVERTGLSGCVQITGFLQGAVLSETLESVGVVIMPSMWEETAGLSAMEQMMRGRLVIASRIGGLAEIIGDAGLLCLPGDAVDLARCMRQALHDSSLLTALGRKAHDRAQSLFLRERMMANHATVYREISR